MYGVCHEFINLFIHFSLECPLKCQNGGTVNKQDCVCSCPSGWRGMDCSGRPLEVTWKGTVFTLRGLSSSLDRVIVLLSPARHFSVSLTLQLWVEMSYGRSSGKTDVMPWNNPRRIGIQFGGRSFTPRILTTSIKTWATLIMCRLHLYFMTYYRLFQSFF